MQLIMRAVDLANQVEKDIKSSGYVSQETILAVSKFKKVHDNLSKHLDLMNLNIDGNDSGSSYQ